MEAYQAPLYRIKLIHEGSADYSADRQRIACPGDLAGFARRLIGDADREHMFVLALNTKHHVVGAHLVSVGTLNGTACHPPEILKFALLANAQRIALAHNHPSGNTTPSHEDLAVTCRLADAAQVLGIKLFDHIIIGPADGFWSWAEKRPEATELPRDVSSQQIGRAPVGSGWCATLMRSPPAEYSA